MYKQEALIVSALLLSVLITSRAAPLVKKSGAEQTSAQVSEHEQELEKLINAENNQVRNPEIHQSHSVSFKNINGLVKEIDQDERTVVNGETGDLVSDLKQQITKSNQPGEHPHTEVDTEVEIPSLGVHQSLSQTDDDENEQAQLPDNEITEPQIDDISSSPDMSEAVDFTPKAVAEYLWETQEFSEFKTALQDLVNSKLMTDSEAWQYYQRVIDEYEKIVADNEQLEQVLPDLYQPLFTPLNPTSNQIPDNKRASAESLYNRLIGPSYDTDSNMYPDARMPYMYDVEPEPMMSSNEPMMSSNDDVAKELIQEWLINALQTGDEQAIRVLQNLNRYLEEQSGYGQFEDDQLREILADLLVETLVNDPEANLEIEQEQERESEQPELAPEYETEVENTDAEPESEDTDNLENNETETSEQEEITDNKTEESSDDNNTEIDNESKTNTEDETNKEEEPSS